jgi:hypothetical protein
MAFDVRGTQSKHDLLRTTPTVQMAYECSSEHVKSFGFAYRMMMEMLGAYGPLQCAQAAASTACSGLRDTECSPGDGLRLEASLRWLAQALFTTHAGL